ncbi:MAG: carboxypeptidase-like regulatory domain-containing protein [Flavobacteriales bacterium]
MRTPTVLLLSFFLVMAAIGKTQEGEEKKYTVSGTITDSSSGEALIGATVKVKGTGTGSAANDYGYYSLTLPEGKYTLIYNYLGKRSVVRELNLTEDKKLNVQLPDKRRTTETVEIRGERADKNVSSVEMSTAEIDIEQMKKLPAFLGEVDVLKTVQRLPGVQSGSEGTTGFYVRGGGADQNLVLLDEATVYNASHFFSFFSVFNPDAVKDIQLYKGGIPARYGGRLSSVLDVRMKEGNKKEYSFSGGIGTISSRLTGEGPIDSGKGSFLVTGRRTYADLFLNFANDPQIRKNQLYFYDLNLKANYRFSETDKLFLSGYFGRDVTGFADAFGFDWGNGTGTLRWNHLFNDKLFANFSYIYTRYSFNISGDVGPRSFSWDSWINDHEFKADFTYYANSDNTLRFGLESIFHNLDPGKLEAKIDGATQFERRLSEKNGLEHGLYLSNQHTLTEDLSAKYGVRASSFHRIGPGKRYELDKSDPLEYKPVDTSSIDKGAVDTAFYNIEPRLSLRYRIDSVSSVKASYDRMVQYVQRSRSSTSGAPYDVWYTSNNNIPPQKADQVAVGYFRNFLDDRLESSLEIYYKKIHQLTDYVDNADVLGNETFETELRLGEGWSYGAEFMLKKKRGDLTGWFSYTWSKTERKVEAIDQGDTYYAPYDRRHDLSLSLAYQLSDRVSISTNFAYKTGRAITLPSARYSFQGNSAPYFPERNSNRLPDYHRWDLAATLGPKDKKDQRFESSWSLSVYNVYARKNPISISFSENDKGEPKTEMFYIPGPLPAITWNFKF